MMKIIDGSQGEGGGQIFRTSLTLALCLGEPVTITNIRAGRKKPGLLRQHLACLNAAQAISDADVQGAALGSSEVVFKPGRVRSGNYHFAVGSAGSTTLVFQTVYLPLCFAGANSEVVFEGGTHNGMAPSFDFIQKSFLPELHKMGLDIDLNLDRYGFYPAGGGAWRAYIQPSAAIGAYHNIQRGELRAITAVATSACIPAHVVERELNRVATVLSLGPEQLRKQLVASVGPGNILSLYAESTASCELVERVGERGISAEAIADKAVAALMRYLTVDAAVGDHLADQLLLPMALGAGGCFTTLKPSLHTQTNAAVIQALTGVKIAIEPLNLGRWQIRVYKGG